MFTHERLIILASGFFVYLASHTFCSSVRIKVQQYRLFFKYYKWRLTCLQKTQVVRLKISKLFLCVNVRDNLGICIYTHLIICLHVWKPVMNFTPWDFNVYAWWSASLSAHEVANKLFRDRHLFCANYFVSFPV